MFAGKRLVSKGKFKPDYITDSVANIDFKLLERQGIKAILVDLDGTVVFRGAYRVDSSVSRALEKQSIGVYIATNRPQSRDLKNLRKQLSAKGVIYPDGIWGKPTKQYYKNALVQLSRKSSEVVMVGDRYIQDIYGANRAGLGTILVRKIDKPVNWIDRIISGLEGRRTKHLIKSYKNL